VSAERLGGELLVVLAVVAAEVFAVELVRPVHRGRKVEVVLLHLSRRGLGVEARQAIRGDAGRVEEHDRPAVALALALGELEQVQCPFDVHLVGQRRAELAPRTEQRGEVVDVIHLELGVDALEQFAVEDRPVELRADPRREVGGERVQVQGDDGPLGVERG